MRIVVLIVPLMILSGCFATQQGYADRLALWVGHTEEAIVRDMGPPTSVYENGARKYLTWSQEAPGTVTWNPKGTYTLTPVGNSVMGTGGGSGYGHSYRSSCTTTFIIEYGVIVSWQFEGNACVL